MGQESSVLDRDTIARLQPVIEKLVQQYQTDGDSAVAEFRSTTRVVRGFENEATAREFTIAVDEPEVLGGTNKGPNPVELLLGALGTCQQIVISAYAAALNIELERLEIDTRGTIDLRGLFNVAPVPSGFQEIRFDVKLAARNATEEQLEQLKALALAHCPVLDTLQREVPVQSRYSWQIDAAAARRSA
jgi:uncharacterized OsmC-like protein